MTTTNFTRKNNIYMKKFLNTLFTTIHTDGPLIVYVGFALDKLWFHPERVMTDSYISLICATVVLLYSHLMNGKIMSKPLITEYQKARTILEEEKVLLDEASKAKKDEDSEKSELLDELYNPKKGE